MSDLTYSRLPVFFETGRNRISVTLLSGQKVYQGGIAAVKIQPSTNAGKFVGVGTDISNADGYSRVVGTFDRDYDASATGTNADITGAIIKLNRPFSALYFVNSTSAPVTAAYVGSVVYVQDNQTVTITAGSNAVAGICWGVDSVLGVLVETLPRSVLT